MKIITNTWILCLLAAATMSCASTTISPQGDGGTPDSAAQDMPNTPDALTEDDAVDGSSATDAMVEDHVSADVPSDQTNDEGQVSDATAPLDEGPVPVDVEPQDEGPDTEPDSGGPSTATCLALRSQLQAEIYKKIQSCTVVLRLNYNTHALISHQVICGTYTQVDEPMARQQAHADTGYGEISDLISGTSPEDFYVFREMLGDFGGNASVSAKTGKTVFGGSTLWSGTGEITYPTTWRDAADLGVGCGLGDTVSVVHGYDLAQNQALSAGDLQEAMDVVGKTVVIPAFMQGGYVFHAVVLLYPRTVGLFDPGNAEWIVLVQGGWLD